MAGKASLRVSPFKVCWRLHYPELHATELTWLLLDVQMRAFMHYAK